MPISYDSRIKTGWNIFLSLVVFILSPYLTYRLTFHHNTPNGAYWFLIAVYLIDIIAGFTISARSKLKVYATYPEISRHYCRRWFVVDILAVIPYEYLLIFVPYFTHHVLAQPLVVLLRLAFLLKMFKLPQLFMQIQENLVLNPVATRLGSFSFFFSHAVHYMSLGWIIIGASETARPFFDQYLRSLYWCVTTVATIGYGDYYPNHDSNIQIIYTIIVQVFGVGMYGYIIGNISAIIANLDKAKSRYLEKIEDVNTFLRAKNIPKDLQKRIRDYYSYMWETRHNVSSASIISELPRSSAVEVLLFLNKDIVEKVSFFKNAGAIFIREVIELLVLEVYLPGDFIIQQGEHGECMFFLSTGSVEVIMNDAVVVTLHEGSPFGETALLSNEKRNASIRALSYCDVYKLSKSDFDVLRGKYPEFDSEMKKVTDARSLGSKKES